MRPDAEAEKRWGGLVDAVLGEIKDLTGHRPKACPWRAFEDPVVRDAIMAHAAMESGQLREVWGDDPAAHLPAAVLLHHRAISVTHEADREKKKPTGDKP